MTESALPSSPSFHALLLRYPFILPSRDAIANPENRVLVSAVSIWEIAVKSALGKLSLALPEGLKLAALPEACGFDELPVRATHAEEVGRLPLHHADPFDRILLAQAVVEELTLVTADRVMSAYRVPRLR